MNGKTEINLKKSREAAAMCACFNLRKATRAVTQLYDGILQETGLRATQFSVLVSVYLNGDITVTRLAEYLVTDRTTLTRNLRPLAEQGYITIRAGRDRRTKSITLTKKGRSALNKALPLWETAQKHMVKGLGKQKFDALLKNLSETVSATQA